MVVADRLVDAVLGGSLADVAEDRGAVGHRLVVTPRAEAIAERVHVGVGADAWIAKQIPGAAHRLAPFEDDETLLRALALQMAGPANPRQPRPHDYHIHVLHSRPLSLAKVYKATKKYKWSGYKILLCLLCFFVAISSKVFSKNADVTLKASVF